MKEKDMEEAVMVKFRLINYKNLEKILKDKGNLDDFLNFLKEVEQGLIKTFSIHQYILRKREAILLNLNGDYIKEFEDDIDNISESVKYRIISQERLDYFKKTKFSWGDKLGCKIPIEKVGKLEQKIRELNLILNGLNYTKSEDLDKALESYCNAIEENPESYFPYISLLSTTIYLSEMDKKLKTLGFSVNKEDLKHSLPLLNKLFNKNQGSINVFKKKSKRSNHDPFKTNFFTKINDTILKDLIGIIVKRDDFQEDLLKVGESANEVFTLDKNVVDRFYIIKRTKKDNSYKKGNLELEFKVLDYFNSINYKPFRKQSTILDTPKPIKLIPKLDKEHNYLILERKKGKNLFSLICEDEQNIDLLIDTLVEQTAKIHALGPISFIKKDKYFTAESNFLNQMSTYCGKFGYTEEESSKIINLIKPLAKIISNSKNFGFVKDSNIENFIVTKENKIIPIDFEEIKYAPLQYDLSKLLLFSYKDKEKLIDKYLEVYNDTLRKNISYLRESDFIDKKSSLKGKKKIHDNDEFKFVFLNYTVFDGLLTYMNPKYKSNYKIRNQALNNAIDAIDELLQKNYEDTKYSKKLNRLYKEITLMKDTLGKH